MQQIKFSSNFNYVLSRYFYKKKNYVWSILFLFYWQKFDKKSIDFLGILFFKTKLHPSFISKRLNKDGKGVLLFNKKDFHSSIIIPLWSAGYLFQKILKKVNASHIRIITKNINSNRIVEQKKYSIFATQIEFIEFFIVHSFILNLLGYNVNSEFNNLLMQNNNTKFDKDFLCFIQK